MARTVRVMCVLVCAWVAVAVAQSPEADPALQRIKTAVDASRLSENLFQLTDAIGPRTIASPALRRAEVWASERLRTYGLQNVHTEPNPPSDIGGGAVLKLPGWSWSRLTVQQLTPWPQTLLAVPVLYSPSTPGTVVGDVVVAPLPRPTDVDIAAFIGRHKGRLRDVFLMLRDTQVPLTPSDQPTFHRYTSREMQDFADAPAPVVPPAAPQPAPVSPGAAPASPPPSMGETLARWSRLFDFLRQEGVLGLITPAGRGSQGGTLVVTGPPTPPTLTSAPPPMFDLAPEHFNRLLRFVQRGMPAKLEVNLQASNHEPAGTENILGEIPGTDRADEIVLVGAHLDSWHGATGATDNAVNVAVVLEALRILRTAHVPLRRSIQVAFWGGEEFGLAGSKAYVQQHLVDQSGGHTAAWDKVSCYLNLDYGSGRIRGIYLQGNVALKPLVDHWLPDLGDGTLVATLRSTLGSDQASFDRVGLPGLSFIQDPLDYESRTHHSTMDTSDYVIVDDMKDSAVTLASVIYKLANTDARLPRKGR